MRFLATFTLTEKSAKCTPRLILPIFDAKLYLQGISHHGATFGFLQLDEMDMLIDDYKGHTETIRTFDSDCSLSAALSNDDWGDLSFQ
jgi:hypothetical protein